MEYKEAIAIEDKFTKMLVVNVKVEHKAKVFVAHKMAIEALERRAPKKPIYTNEGTVTRCPNCEAIHFRCLPSVEVDYCVRCGQAIDWSEVE